MHNYKWIITIQIVGMLFGFIWSAAKKGEGDDAWWHGHRHSWSSDDDYHIPFLLTIFWWVIPIIYIWKLFVWIANRCVKIFSSSIDKVSVMIKNQTFSLKRLSLLLMNFQKMYHPVKGYYIRYKNRNVKSDPIAPRVTQNYRIAGPHPCIACGGATSHDQSNMKIVLDDDVIVEDMLDEKRVRNV